MNSAFGRRCEAALIHPVTVAALVVLLLNDLVFKSVWPGSWVTGKLSDLAWVVFALPLLAFLLSLVVGKSVAGHRVAFIASYVGLPLLYAAYNTFEPVYYWIIRGLSVMSGGTAGSPQDVTDSVVIPLGLVVALWVWRRFDVRAERPRLRWAPLMAGVAAFASVATSTLGQDVGISQVGVADDGTVYADTSFEGVWLSHGGGMSWDRATNGWFQSGGTSADTPRGRYTIRGSDVLLIDADGESRIVYSGAYLQHEGNVWVQEHATARLGFRRIVTGPSSIVYDERSGNLIAALGIQGVVVGTPDGAWTRYAVGRYSPTDFSFVGKTRLLLSNVGFWAASLALSLSMTGFALVLSQYRRRDFPLVAAVPLAALVLLVILTMVLVVIELGLVGLTPVIVCVPFVVAVVLGIVSEDDRVRKSVGLVMGVSSLLASCLLVGLFGGSDAGPVSSVGLFMFLTAVPAFVLGISAVAIARHQLAHWRAVLGAILGMNALVILAFMLWLHLGIVIVVAQVSSIVLAALTGLVLIGYLKREEQAG